MQSRNWESNLGRKSLVQTYVKDQNERGEKALRRLYKFSVEFGVEKLFVMYYESYFPVVPSQVSGNEYCNIVDDCEVDIEARRKRKLKFYDKYLVWVIAQND